MGMFDTVRYDCPHCKKEIQEQFKCGDCILDCFTLDEIDPKLFDMFTNELDICYHCDKFFSIQEIDNKLVVIKEMEEI